MSSEHTGGYGYKEVPIQKWKGDPNAFRFIAKEWIAWSNQTRCPETEKAHRVIEEGLSLVTTVREQCRDKLRKARLKAKGTWREKVSSDIVYSHRRHKHRLRLDTWKDKHKATYDKVMAIAEAQAVSNLATAGINRIDATTRGLLDKDILQLRARESMGLQWVSPCPSVLDLNEDDVVSISSGEHSVHGTNHGVKYGTAKSKGLDWLIEYLKTEQGEKVVVEYMQKFANFMNVRRNPNESWQAYLNAFDHHLRALTADDTFDLKLSDTFQGLLLYMFANIRADQALILSSRLDLMGKASLQNVTKDEMTKLIKNVFPADGRVDSRSYMVSDTDYSYPEWGPAAFMVRPLEVPTDQAYSAAAASTEDWSGWYGEAAWGPADWYGEEAYWSPWYGTGSGYAAEASTGEDLSYDDEGEPFNFAYMTAEIINRTEEALKSTEFDYDGGTAPLQPDDGEDYHITDGNGVEWLYSEALLTFEECEWNEQGMLVVKKGGRKRRFPTRGRGKQKDGKKRLKRKVRAFKSFLTDQEAYKGFKGKSKGSDKGKGFGKPPQFGSKPSFGKSKDSWKPRGRGRGGGGKRTPKSGGFGPFPKGGFGKGPASGKPSYVRTATVLQAQAQNDKPIDHLQTVTAQTSGDAGSGSGVASLGSKSDALSSRLRSSYFLELVLFLVRVFGYFISFIATFLINDEQVEAHIHDAFLCTAHSYRSKCKNANESAYRVAPGHAVLDLGCSKAMVSDYAKRELVEILKSKGCKKPVISTEPSYTSYGFADGGKSPTYADHLAEIITLLGGQQFETKWEVLKAGTTPFLFSLPQMKNLYMNIYCTPDGCFLTSERLGWIDRPLQEQAGHLVINLAETAADIPINEKDNVTKSSNSYLEETAFNAGLGDTSAASAAEIELDSDLALVDGWDDSASTSTIPYTGLSELVLDPAELDPQLETTLQSTDSNTFCKEGVPEHTHQPSLNTKARKTDALLCAAEASAESLSCSQKHFEKCMLSIHEHEWCHDDMSREFFKDFHECFDAKSRKKMKDLKIGPFSEAEVLRLHEAFGHCSSGQLRRKMNNLGYPCSSILSRNKLNSILAKCSHKECQENQARPRRPHSGGLVPEQINQFVAQDSFFPEYRGKTVVCNHQIDCLSKLQVLDSSHENSANSAIAAKWKWDSHYGAPVYRITDNGSEYINTAYTDSCSRAGTEHRTIPTYCGFSNGIVERAHQKAEFLFKVLHGQYPTLSLQHLTQIIQFLLNEEVKANGKTPFEMHLGYKVKAPDFTEWPPAWEDAADEVCRLRDKAIAEGRQALIRFRTDIAVRAALKHRLTQTITDITTGDKCWFFRMGKVGVDDQWVGPARCLAKHGKSVIVSYGGVCNIVHVSRVKPYLIGSTDISDSSINDIIDADGFINPQMANQRGRRYVHLEKQELPSDADDKPAPGSKKARLEEPEPPVEVEPNHRIPFGETPVSDPIRPVQVQIKSPPDRGRGSRPAAEASSEDEAPRQKTPPVYTPLSKPKVGIQYLKEPTPKQPTGACEFFNMATPEGGVISPQGTDGAPLGQKGTDQTESQTGVPLGTMEQLGTVWEQLQEVPDVPGEQPIQYPHGFTGPAGTRSSARLKIGKAREPTFAKKFGLFSNTGTGRWHKANTGRQAGEVTVKSTLQSTLFSKTGVARGGRDAYMVPEHDPTGEVWYNFVKTLGMNACAAAAAASWHPGDDVVDPDQLRCGPFFGEDYRDAYFGEQLPGVSGYDHIETVADRISSAHSMKTTVVQEDTPMRHLTAAEIVKHKELVEAARILEYQSFAEEQTFAILNRCDLPMGRKVVSARELLQWKKYTEQVKCRVVLRGFQDDRSTDRAVDSPTLRMESWRLITQQAADNGWQLWKFDLKTAFLQGVKYDEEEEVVYWNPPEFFRKYFGMQQGEICVALKSVYGLNDAPRRWYEKLAEAFMYTMGMERHWLDPCLFQLFEPTTANSNAAAASTETQAAEARFPKDSQEDVAAARATFKKGFSRNDMNATEFRRYNDVASTGALKTSYYQGLKPVLSVGAHVDDLYCTGTPEHLTALKAFLEKEFLVGSVEYADSKNGFLYRGVRVRQVTPNHIIVDMDEYIEREIKPCRFDVCSKCKNTYDPRVVGFDKLPASWRCWCGAKKESYHNKRASKTESEHVLDTFGQELYRTYVGKLIWCVTNIKADIATKVSQAASRLGKATIGDAIALNAIIVEGCKRQVHFHYKKLADLSVPRRLEIVGDAAHKHADEPDQKSRGGMLLLLGVDKTKSDKVSLLGYSSKKILRVAKSPTSAEAINISACLDELDFAYHLAISFYPNLEFTSFAYTDSYSITSTQDKYCKDVNPNLAVDVAIIRQKVRSGEIALMHIPGDNMPADGLTKASWKALQPLLIFLENFRLGVDGVPMKYVDAYASSFITGEVNGGRIQLDNFDSKQLKAKLDPFVERDVRQQVLLVRDEWETKDFESDAASEDTVEYAADDILLSSAWMPIWGVSGPPRW